jgi:hypothetical protein
MVALHDRPKEAIEVTITEASAETARRMPPRASMSP